mmetsp:Transcript_2089/g.6822  ORF Transcript_2089/g.6822 Transcript_2089/m.6822 type:complete len:320 (+) Transcript_2089:33-992(+)
MGGPCRREGRLGRCAALAAALALATTLCRRERSQGGPRLFGLARPFARGPRTPRLPSACRGGESGEETAWKEAYDLEVERNQLLRDQLQSLGVKTLLLDPEAPQPRSELEACEVDWAQNYEQLAECNRALEAELRGPGAAQPPSPPATATAVAVATGPAKLTVPVGEQGATETIELSRFFGDTGAFYALQAQLPLGLNLTKRDSGSLFGAFVVEDVLPGGAAEASGEVRPGDILQALTVVMEGSDLGMKAEDFVSSVVGGLGRYRQVLTDATFIDSPEDLVEAIKSNTMLSSEARITLVFERDTSALPVPAEPLEPIGA